ncbi:zinc metalloprotease [Natrinema salifodinae]|uniref:Metallo-peptidase family M12 n=1 Tax=Natrinema salifodinae TaxID=1202768 RepID=A0A1I0M1E0_9EURY|nr:M12 family metallo-peptidase [Natrinema salifodinae]SEV82173.1 Metallo-peptidase family M12 [Natrinema salifodinae]
MKRRAFLGAVGSTVSFTTLAYATGDSGETLAVQVRLSERAATYDGVGDRIREYLGRMLAFGRWTLDLSIGDTVSVSTEDAARVTRRGEWPMTVARETLGDRERESAADVNLLVTDGGMDEAPTGYGFPHVASVGGARHIAALEPFDELVVDDARRIVPHTTRTRTIQVLAHEVGHALGLRHDHGVAFLSGDAVVATPMLSAYAWDSDYTADASRCGTTIPATDGREQKLSLAFSACARRALADDDDVPP